MQQASPKNSRPTAQLTALVTVRWGDVVLATRHLGEGKSATIGAESRSMAPLPCELLGLFSLVVAEVKGGVPVAYVPRGAVGFRERPRALPSPVAGPSEITLAAGDTLSYSIGKFLVEVTAEEAEKAPWAAAAPLSSLVSPLRHVALVAIAHAAFMGLSAQAAHAASLEAPPDEHADLARYLAAADSRSHAEEAVSATDGLESLGINVNDHDGNGKDGGGARARGPEGSMGAGTSRSKDKSRYGVPGSKLPEYNLPSTREDALADARSFGMASLVAVDPVRGGIYRFVDAEPSGPDAFEARGAMWGTSVGETFGAGGLGLTGKGEGGGGTGEGIGLGEIGTVGHTFGRPGAGAGGGGGLFGLGLSGTSGWGHPWGVGISLGTIGTIGRGSGYIPTVHVRRPEKAEEDGESRLPPHVIRRVVRANLGRFRACYQGALVSNPSLAGGVTTRFLIGRGGAVQSAQTLSADLPDKGVVSCVTRAFYGLMFPEPPGGRPVTVTYPLTFSPDR